jgi:hypothetical protein
VLLAGIAVIAIAGYAVGAGKSSENVVLCAAKKGGDLSLAAKGKCGKGEKKLTISQKGPQGAVGPQGAPGALGSDANVALEPITYVTGPANDECFAKPATFCESGLGYIQWSNYDPSGAHYGRVGFYKDASGPVHLTGVASASVGGASSSFEPEGPFYLPPAYRPQAVRMFTVPSQTGSEEEFTDTVVIMVRPNGVVALRTNDNYRQIALDGVVFRP